MLYFYFFKATFLSQKRMTFFFVLSVAVSMLCVNVMYSYSQSVYQNSYDGSWYTSIGIVDVDREEIPDYESYIEETYHVPVGSILYFSRLEDDSVLIGWNGADDAGKWFPHMGGRFFSSNELKEGNMAVYLTADEYRDISNKNVLTIGASEYQVIGYGWIGKYAFYDAISTSSAQTIFDLTSKGGEIIEGSYYDKFRVIPAKVYLREGHRPGLVLVHLREQSYAQLQKIVEQLRTDFPGASITIPDQNSNELRNETDREFVIAGAILAGIVLVSSISVLFTILDSIQKKVRIFVICGISRRKMTVYVLRSLVLVYVAAEATALLLQTACNSILRSLGVSCFARFRDMALVFVVLNAAVLPFAWKRIWRITLTERRSIE